MASWLSEILAKLPVKTAQGWLGLAGPRAPVPRGHLPPGHSILQGATCPPSPPCPRAMGVWPPLRTVGEAVVPLHR